MGGFYFDQPAGWSGKRMDSPCCAIVFWQWDSSTVRLHWSNKKIPTSPLERNQSLDWLFSSRNSHRWIKIWPLSAEAAEFQSIYDQPNASLLYAKLEKSFCLTYTLVFFTIPTKYVPANIILKTDCTAKKMMSSDWLLWVTAFYPAIVCRNSEMLGILTHCINAQHIPLLGQSGQRKVNLWLAILHYCNLRIVLCIVYMLT